MDRYIYALGFFDGVHVGHQALLQAVKALAGETGRGVITFSAHPDTLVLGRTPKLINTPQDRVRLLKQFGMERVVTLPFDPKMQDTPWQDFLEEMQSVYAAAGFVCGEDFRFGRGGQGTAALLARYAEEKRLPWAVVPEQTVDGMRVSSTAIRQQLEEGNMAQAVRFLGHPYLLSGQVVHGKQLGRTLGIPTANLLLPPELVTPRFGVYGGRAYVAGGSYPAVTNIGVRPTVSGKGITVESWILDYSGDLYGDAIALELTDFIRPERKFDSLEELKAEILRNAETVRALTAQNPVFKKSSHLRSCFMDENPL